MVSSFFSRSRSHDDGSERRDRESEVTPADVSARGVDFVRAINRWREDLARITRISTDDEDRPILELTHAHPGGMAQLFAERPTRLTTLVRERGERDAARDQARKLIDRNRSMASLHGASTLHLAMGRAQWNTDSGVTSSPLLLRPVTITLDSLGEPVFELGGDLSIAPAVLDALRATGKKIDEGEIIRSTNQAHGFTPAPALHRLKNELTGFLPGFDMGEQIEISHFLHPAHVLEQELEDASWLRSNVFVRALSGDEEAVKSIPVTLPEPNPHDRDPWKERGIGDQLPEQLDRVEAAAAGANILFDTAGDVDASSTVASILVDAAVNGKKALFVSADRHHNARLWSVLHEHNLAHSTARLDGSEDSADAFTRTLRDIFRDDPTFADRDAIELARTELRRVRSTLAAHTEELHRTHATWGVSPHDALQVLTDLTSMRPGPRTSVRLNADALTKLAEDKDDVAKATLQRACEQGMFAPTSAQDAWFGAVISASEQVGPVLERIERLATETIPTLRINMTSTAGQIGLTPATTFDEWEEQLRMLDGIREALDVFQPAIFERSAADMVIATASKQWRRDNDFEMKRSVRNRLKKQAKDLLRPGRYVDDLNAELRKVQKQREIWRRHCEAGGWPKLPPNLDEMVALAASARQDLEKLNPHLATAHGNLTRIDIGELSALIERLNSDPSGAAQLPQLIETLKVLHGFGLDAFVKDIRSRRVPASLVEKELDLAWWASALGFMIDKVPSLGGFNPATLQDLIERLRALDQQQTESLHALASDRIRRARADILVDNYDEEKAIRAALAASIDDPIELYSSSALMRRMVPIVISSPVLVPAIAPVEEPIDLVVIDSIDSLPLSEVIPIIGRARQLIVTADTTSDSETITALAPLLAYARIEPGAVRVNEYVGQLFSRYNVRHAGVSVPVPRSGSKLTIEYVHGRGMPAPDAIAVESSKEEVNAVVDMVVEHALMRPDDSLAVAALNNLHADHIRDQLRQTISTSPALTEFFRPDRSEYFTVIEPGQAEGIHRDRVILSVGFAKTPHGRVLHDFGEISGDNGLELLAGVLACAVGDLDIVSSVRPGEFDRERFSEDGARMLLDLLARAEGTTDLEDGQWPTTQAAPDQLLIDLADRLYNVGLTVIPNIGIEGGFRIPLAIGHPQIPGELLVAILTDDDDYVKEPSLRRRDRHWPALLENYGWKTRTELGMAVFIDPQHEADSIVDLVLDAVDERIAENPELGAAYVVENGGEDNESENGTDERADFGEDAGSSGGESPETESEVAEGTASADAMDPVDAPGVETAEQRKIRVQADEDIHGTAEENIWRAAGHRSARRPAVAVGLPLAAYSDDQLDDVTRWIRSDGVERTDDELIDEIQHVLQLKRRGAQVEAVLRHVVRRTRNDG
ncbi:MAG: prevent-host-death family protein [Actinomycetaceae bacterium]|nr:prevent-host-death family protein [Actinomycetaceae bacterium]